MFNRRQFLIGTTAVGSYFALSRLNLAQETKRTRIILLGTKGGPTLSSKSGRANSATLILINDVPYLIDCGYGVSRQLILAGVALNRLRYVFITHDHSDHKLEFSDLLYIE